ncbi:hypothetical protein MKZ38_004671 [Zalerion maritima]|uniref:Uncharacterized protein n=1 Tax=Zalerion maritima TaxID=339359 RepID=A0AAD5RL12_9PEZI|nr:hypothetical protein MKZ38_004671 [Zalerion maritima]
MFLEDLLFYALITLLYFVIPPPPNRIYHMAGSKVVPQSLTHTPNAHWAVISVPVAAGIVLFLAFFYLYFFLWKYDAILNNWAEPRRHQQWRRWMAQQPHDDFEPSVLDQTATSTALEVDIDNGEACVAAGPKNSNYGTVNGDGERGVSKGQKKSVNPSNKNTNGKSGQSSREKRLAHFGSSATRGEPSPSKTGKKPAYHGTKSARGLREPPKLGKQPMNQDSDCSDGDPGPSTSTTDSRGRNALPTNPGRELIYFYDTDYSDEDICPSKSQGKDAGYKTD